MHRCIRSIVVLMLLAGAARAEQPADTRRSIDLAICLDTSGSMDGLLDAARQKLWGIVNELAQARPAPRLRVALLTYGNDGHPAADGWVCVQTGLTEDLDVVSQKLFALTTNGGTEYVARVLNTALEKLAWSKEPGTLALAIVAGNESADQDREMSFRDVCKRAIERGITVNAIYCGNPQDDIAPGWREVAARADGQFACIDQDHGTVVVTSPFDQELAKLGTSLNETYIPLGSVGRAGAENQSAQDLNAAGASCATAACRAATKASGLYTCGWDLVDAVRQKQVKLADVKIADLPAALQAMSPAEREQYVASAAGKRGELQKKIQALDQKRQAYVAAELAKQALDEGKSFDQAVRRAVRAQAGAKGFSFPSD
jgi:hypothetical protein